MSVNERMEYILKGASWEEAEEVGVEILARCMALHAYAREDGEKFFEKIMKRICERGDEWARNNATVLGFAAAGYKLKKNGEIRIVSNF